MNFVSAGNSSADGIANCDSCGTATGKFSVERHIPLRPVRLRRGAVRLPLWRAIEAHLAIFLLEHNNSRSSRRVSATRSMQGACPRKFRTLARSIRGLSLKCGSAGSLRPRVGKPNSFKRTSIRSRPILNSTDPSTKTRRRETRIALQLLEGSGSERIAPVSCH